MHAGEQAFIGLHLAGLALGLACGEGAARVTRVFSARLALEAGTSRATYTHRHVLIVLLTAIVWTGVAHVLAGAPGLSLMHAAFLLCVNGILGALVLALGAIDLEHMVLPNALTLGGTLVCLATAPVRAVGLADAAVGAAIGLLVSTLPLLVYSRLRKQSGLGLGDAKLAMLVGAWHGALGGLFAMGLAGLQLAGAAAVLRAAGKAFAVPPSVTAELDHLRARAEAGDAEAKRELALDPMAAGARDGLLAMRLPFGPFLALASLEVLFARRWLVELALAWVAR